MTSVFIAYASGNQFHGSMIENSAKDASTPERSVTPWSRLDTSGHPIAESVERWIDEADALIGDVSVVNDNVTYEIGYAVGLGKPVRFIRSTQIDWEPVRSIGLLDTLGHDSYDLRHSLTSILRKADITPHWPRVEKVSKQPIFLLQPPQPTEASLRTISAVKKIARVLFRTFNPSEISRLTASEAYEKVAASSGLVVFWDARDDLEAVRNNQRASFMFGVARGSGIPALLIAHQQSRLPLDLDDQASRWQTLPDFDKLISQFRLDVADFEIDLPDDRPDKPLNNLEILTCGDPVAENEASSLFNIFLETEGFQKALDGQANVLVGRKGSGKTAIFLQVRDACRRDKQNIVIDLIPDGYQLVKMKEFILDQLGLGARKEVVAAFWEYVLWLEISYKIIEKDELKALRDPRLIDGFRNLETLFLKRVDTGRGDFSERLKRLSTNIIGRFNEAGLSKEERSSLDSSKVLEIIYSQDIKDLREAVLSYLRLKGFVLFLMDNLDRFWTPGGFGSDDALIVVGLTESMQEIQRKFHRGGLDFRWVIFVRSDVYEFLVRGMADYGKLGVESIEWADRALLGRLFQQRLTGNLPKGSPPWEKLWRDASVQIVGGKPILDFLTDGCMMRPRYMIRLFETARRRAITFDRRTIMEEDYFAAQKELGWQVLEDLDREVVDLVPDGGAFLFELLQERDELTPEKFRYFCGTRLKNSEDVDRLLDVMLWNGSIGVLEGTQHRFIFDCGYKRQYLSAKIKANPNVSLVIHPTLLAAIQ